MFNLLKLFKGISTRAVPVIVVTGKIKYDEVTMKYSFWPNYAKSNGLKKQYDIGHLAKHPCKFPNATCVGIFNANYRTLLAFSNGSDGMAMDVIMGK